MDEQYTRQLNDLTTVVQVIQSQQTNIYTAVQKMNDAHDKFRDLLNDVGRIVAVQKQQQDTQNSDMDKLADKLESLQREVHNSEQRQLTNIRDFLDRNNRELNEAQEDIDELKDDVSQLKKRSAVMLATLFAVTLTMPQAPQLLEFLKHFIG